MGRGNSNGWGFEKGVLAGLVVIIMCMVHHRHAALTSSCAQTELYADVCSVLYCLGVLMILTL
jgi:hypothetical protein